MSRRMRLVKLVTFALVASFPAAFVAGPAAAAPAEGSGASSSASGAARGHTKRQPPIVRKWQADRAHAADLVARGKAAPDENGVVQLKNGTFVQHRLDDTDHIVTLLADFSDFAHNTMPEPDRSVDNSTYWIDDFSRDHYEDMLFAPGGGSYGFASMRDFYLQQSSGAYTVEGQVSEWVPLTGTQASYGANSREGDGSDNANGPVYRVIRDALLATQNVNEGINWSPAVVDVWDRYDCDGDGNFDEADGYVDHFQLVHAGDGEEGGGGPDAIWSHRWYANNNSTEGPTGCKFGGYRVPGTNLWVGDYTIEPENGGVGVFAHEFGHDLGLPDLYDTAGGENGTGFWTIMSSGSWASDDPDAIGTNPVHMGPWEKLVLGWLDLATASATDRKTFDLGPAEGASRYGDQALRVNLPNYSKTSTLFTPEGSDPYYYYSGSGDDLDQRMTRTLSAPLAAATALTFRANYDIETDWDYAYVEATTDGTTWLPVNGNLSTATNPNGQNFGSGITGSTGGAWVSGTYTLPAGTRAFRFRYWTDVSVVNPGFAVDSIALGSLFSDNGSTPANWALSGFSRIANGQVTNTYFHYYLAESRSYVLNDSSLCGAYNFLWGNWLEKQCYADGLLVWYRNSAYADNNTSQHPGAGQILPVDAHPAPSLTPDGKGYWRSRWQVWDATFGVDTNAVTLHEQATRTGKVWEKTYTANAVRAFVDASPTSYWDSRIPRSSVKTAGSGIRLEIVGVSPDRTTYRVKLN